MLASYMLSSGCFLHPISRRELSAEECRRLDEYLEAHGLGKAVVAETFAHKEQYTAAATPHNAVARTRAAANGILAALFENAAENSRQRNSQGRGGGGRRGGRGAPQAASAQFYRAPAAQRGPAVQKTRGLAVVDDDLAGEEAAFEGEQDSDWPELPQLGAAAGEPQEDEEEQEPEEPELEEEAEEEEEEEERQPTEAELEARLELWIYDVEPARRMFVEVG